MQKLLEPLSCHGAMNGESSAITGKWASETGSTLAVVFSSTSTVPFRFPNKTHSDRDAADHSAPNVRNAGQTIFGYPRDFLGNQWVYLTLSPSARGLAMGINVDPAPPIAPLDIEPLEDELMQTLDLVQSGRLASLPAYRNLPSELLELRHVALSGDGEPTCAPHFMETVGALRHVRALSAPEFFRVVLVTNAARFDWHAAQLALRQLTTYDEAWVQIDPSAPTMLRECTKGPARSETRILADVAALGREHPLVVQSLFSLLNGEEPADTEIDAYIRNLNRLLSEGTRITRVQIYSVPSGGVTEKTRHHLPLRTLGSISERVEASTGLPAEVF